MANAPGQGRKPTPTKLKLLRGNPGKRLINESEPQPDPSIPEPPRQLNQYAREEWDRISAELLILGLITKVDRAALAAYCDAWGVWCDSKDSVAKFGSVLFTKDGTPIESPYQRIADRNRLAYVRFAAEFGMTPSARSRVTAAGAKDERDEFDKLFGAGA